jgi:hypothetical protein
MLSVRAHASEKALMETIVTIEGTFLFAQIFRELAFDDLPAIVETSTLTYGCCANGYKVKVPVKVNRVSYPNSLSYLELCRDSRNGTLKTISYHSLKEIRRITI